MRIRSLTRAVALALAALPGWLLHRLQDEPAPAAPPAVGGERPAAAPAARPAEKKDDSACVVFITCNGIYE